MRRIDSFVYGHVVGAFLVGLVGGSLLDLTAVLAFSSSMAVAAAISAVVCWWWPKFGAAAWQLWLIATFGNPLMLAGLFWSAVEYDCLIGSKTGWDCLFAEIGPVVAAACLPSPLIGLVVRWLWRRRLTPRSPSTGGP